MNDFRTYSQTVSQRLLFWSAFSIGLGGRQIFVRSPFWRGVGLHFLAWGGIDGLIALVGLRQAGRQSESETDTAKTLMEADRLERLLWVNSGLDLLYLWVGSWLYRKKGKADAGWRGQGVGVLIQGGFLLVFDLFHALRLGQKKPGFTEK